MDSRLLLAFGFFSVKSHDVFLLGKKLVRDFNTTSTWIQHDFVGSWLCPGGQTFFLCVEGRFLLPDEQRFNKTCCVIFSFFRFFFSDIYAYSFPLLFHFGFPSLSSQALPPFSWQCSGSPMLFCSPWSCHFDLRTEPRTPLGPNSFCTERILQEGHSRGDFYGGQRTIKLAAWHLGGSCASYCCSKSDLALLMEEGVMESQRLEDKEDNVRWVLQPPAWRSGLPDLDAQQGAPLVVLKLDLQRKGLTSELYFHANGFLWMRVWNNGGMDERSGGRQVRPAWAIYCVSWESGGTSLMFS